MQRCTSCGRWGGRPEEACPHCGKRMPASDPITADLVSEFVEDADEGDVKRFLAEETAPRKLGPAALASLLDKQRRAKEAAKAAPARNPAEAPPPVVEPLHFSGEAGPPQRPLDVPVRTVVERSSLPQDDEPLVHVLVTMTPDGPSALEPSDGPIAHLILALDVSASMNHPDKYPVLTEAISGMLYDLKKPGAADVLLSVVVYAYGSETVFRDVPASSLDPRDVLRQIDRSTKRFGRYTDAAGALSRAGRIAYDSIQRNRRMPVRICLLTDGRPQDMDGARARMAIIRKMPVDVDGLAFGRDADLLALQELISGGRGGTVKQIRADTLGDAFGRIAEVASAVVTNRALVEFELRPGVAGGSAYRHRPGRHRFPDGCFEGGRLFRTDLGTLEAGRSYSLLFQVRLPQTKAYETEIGRFTVHVPTAAGTRLFEGLVSVPRHEGTALPEADPEVQTARDVLVALGKDDPTDQLRALRVRRKLYEAERRDPQILEALDRAIAELEERGSLAALPAEDRAAILSHTCTAGGLRGRPSLLHLP